MLHNQYRSMAILMLAIIAVGCSKEDLTGALDKAKNAVSENATKAKDAVQAKMESTTEQVQEQLNLAGSIELTAGDVVKTDACYVSLIPQGAGRPTVLQLQSYRDAERESFPSVFLQAHVQANSITELVGEPLAARLFVQRVAEGPILFSDVDAPVELKITAIENNLVSAQLTGSKLRDTTTGAEIPVTGSISGVLE
ncbi:MAG TPA: hypothetical protein P5307_08320 [Pirellulaceae bacterium]|nr:hypothetical protein [Planctomycetales bacterium]MCA9145876.1 hypothetical protein [Planctomycetales bacterium]MCB9939897.1 hypothetical protein [Planctomycetaceae bacterium]HRX79053.1 hypothetical protein [Pirellulaceae bacterium]